MKIKNLKKYIENISGSKFDFLLSSEKSNPFYKELFGGASFNLEYQIEEISGFAKNSNTQIFYELLQNADDSNATSFVCFFDEKNFIAINNGESFYTDGSTETGDKGRLLSFLKKNAGQKHNDSKSIGKHGQGSKLLYDLLTPEILEDSLEILSKGERLKTAIKDQNIGPILFSWEGYTSLEKFKNWEKEEFSFDDNLLANNSPLLTKILYTYFPFLPTINDERFNFDELESCVSFLKKNIDRFNRHEFNRGTLLYLNLGEGRQDQILRAFEGDSLMSGITTSLALLPGSLQQVQINDTIIQRPGKFECYTLFEDPKKKTELILPKSPEKIEEELTNFYQYFPVTDEVHGLKFIINSAYFTIKGSRQEIDVTDTYNQEVLKKISKRIQELYAQWVNEKKLIEANNFLKCLALSTPKSTKEIIIELFYDRIIDFIREVGIPCHDGRFHLPDNIFIQKTELDLSRLHEELKAYPLIPEFDEIHNFLNEKFEIENLNIVDILSKTDELPTLNEWLINLKESEYNILLEEVFSQSGNDIKDLRFVRTNDKGVYSISDFVEVEQNRILIESRTKNLIKIFNDQNIVITDDFSDAEEIIYDIIDDETLFGILNSIIDYENLQPQEKWQVFQNFQENFNIEEELFRNELKLFSNIEGELVPLSKLMLSPIESFSSSLFNTLQIKPTENYYQNLNSYFLQENEWWSYILENWEEIKDTITKPDKVYDDLEKSWKLKGNGEKLSNNGNWVWEVTENENWHSPENCFFNKKCLIISDDEFEILKKLVERSSNLIMPDKKVLEKIYSINCLDYSESSLEKLKDHFEKNQILVSKEELEILNKVKLNESFFTSFLIKEEAGQLLLSLKDDGIQYFSRQRDLNSFLLTEVNYQYLPESLLPIFQFDKSLRTEDDFFVRKLIRDFGPIPELIQLVKNRGIGVKAEYLKLIETIKLKSDNSIEDDYHRALLGLIAQMEMEEEFKPKTFIDDTRLNSFTYQPNISLNWNSIVFTLSKLVDIDEPTNASAFESVKDKFRSTRTGSFFKKEKYPIDEIKKELISKEKLENSTQLAFLIEYYNTTEIEERYDYETVSELDFSQINDKVFLNLLYEKRINNFNRYLEKSNLFIPDRFIDSNEDDFLLDSEKVPDWVVEWIDSDEKRTFLYNNGMENSWGRVLELRKALAKRESFTINDLRKTCKQKWLAHNTFKWFSEVGQNLEHNQNQYRVISKFIFEYFTVNKEIPEYLIQLKVGGTPVLSKVEEVNKNCFYTYSKEFAANILSKGIEVSGYNLFLIRDSNIKENFKNALVEKEIYKLKIYDELIERNRERTEWKEDFYKIWIEEQNEYRIYLSTDEIEYDYKIEIGNEFFEVGKFPTIGGTVLGDNPKEIIIKENDEPKRILDVLEANKEVFFKKDSDHFIALLKLYYETQPLGKIEKILDEQNIDEEAVLNLIESLGTQGIQIINQQNLTPDQLIAKLNAVGEGGPDLGPLSPDEIENLKTNIKNVNKLLAKISPEQFDKLLERLDDLLELADKLKGKSVPNLLTGHIGEVLVVEWLKKRHAGKNVSIKHVSIVEDDEGRFMKSTYEKYDIELTFEGMQYLIDVKTNRGSFKLNEEENPFFVSAREYRFIVNNKLDNYYIFRLSLHDLALRYIYEHVKGGSDFESILRQKHTLIKKLIRMYLDNPENMKKIREHRFTFRVYVPQIEHSPF